MRKAIVILCIVSGLSSTHAHAQIGRVETGTASYYHDKFVGRHTASGEIYSQEKMTAAHKTLPLGTWVKVTNLSNDSSVIVKINDRMPKSNSRSIDLTEMAAGKLNYLAKGLTKVRIEVIPAPNTAAITQERDLPVIPIQPIKVDKVIVAAGEMDIDTSPLPDDVTTADITLEKEKRKRRL